MRSTEVRGRTNQRNDSYSNGGELEMQKKGKERKNLRLGYRNPDSPSSQSFKEVDKYRFLITLPAPWTHVPSNKAEIDSNSDARARERG
jgi:hypothetical protein